MGRVKKKPVLALLCVVLSILTIAAMMPGMVYAEENTVGESTTEKSATPQIEEPAVNPTTTVPNNYHENLENVSNDKIGTDISSWLFSKDVSISAEDVKNNRTLAEISDDFKNSGDIGKNPCSDLVMKGDMSIKNPDGTYDTTKNSAHAVEKDSKHDIKANLNVSAVHKSIDGLENLEILENIVGNVNDVYVNNLETGFCATFSIGKDLNGEFYVPQNLADAKEHYELSSGDTQPLIYRINYAASHFSKDKVTIVMDLDLTQMIPLKNQYSGDHYFNKDYLYGKNESGKPNIIENFNHNNEYSTTYNTSVFGNLKALIDNSAEDICLNLNGVQLYSATGNKKIEETDTATTTTTQGTIKGTLVGYMKAKVGRYKIPVSYVWGGYAGP